MRFFYFTILILASLSLSAQSRTDTIRFGSGSNYEVRTFDDNNVLRLSCRYFLDIYLEWETVYEYNGQLQRSIYFGPKDMRIVRQFNSETGNIEISEYNTFGKLWDWHEEASDSFDARYISYYPDGTKEAEGFQREVPVFKVDSVDSVRVFGQLEKQYGMVTTKVGLWHYYNSVGKDSSIGNYAYQAYQFVEKIPASDCDNASMFLMLDVVLQLDGIKNGVWSYFSAEGKLICIEEWDKGNLLKRETF